MSQQEIKCPKCGSVFKVDETSYANIVKQVHDREFDQEIAARIAALENEQLLKSELAKKAAVAALEKEKLSLESALALAESRERDFAAQKQTEIALAEAKLKDEATKTIQTKEAEIAQLKAQVTAERRYYEDEIARIKEFNERLSTKMVGESLENFCHEEFEKIRALAFPDAIFGKDNEVSKSSKSKGDFIFRDIVDGIESTSIMFECKNENEETEKKQKNEKFFKELDKDRREKKCEYAILVSTLEKDSDLYNRGVVNVSSQQYPKMYVIRPQFFITMINIITLAARQSIETKKSLELAKQQNVDLTNFETNLKDFISGWQGTVSNAAKKHQEAIEGIDKIIAALEKVKTTLETSDKHLAASDNKLEKLTIRRLTSNAPSVAEKLAALRPSDSAPDPSGSSI